MKTTLCQRIKDWLRPPPANPVVFETYRGAKGQFYNRVRRSGRIIFDGGEGYKNASDARTTIYNTISAIRSGDFKLQQ